MRPWIRRRKRYYPLPIWAGIWEWKLGPVPVIAIYHDRQGRRIVHTVWGYYEVPKGVSIEGATGAIYKNG